MPRGPNTRQTILDRALRLFVEQGFAETTTRDIAAAVGISEGAIYRHFASKDAIGWELFQTSYAAMAERLEGVIAGTGDFGAALQAIIAELCRVFDRDPFRFRYLLLAQHQFLHRVTARMKSPIKVLRLLIERGIAEGKVGIADAAVATAFAQGPLLMTAQAVVYRAVKPPLTRWADEIHRATLSAIAAEGH